MSNQSPRLRLRFVAATLIGCLGLFFVGATLMASWHNFPFSRMTWIEIAVLFVAGISGCAPLITAWAVYAQHKRRAICFGITSLALLVGGEVMSGIADRDLGEAMQSLGRDKADAAQF